MTTLLQDLKYGLRMLRKSPGFTLIAIAILAIGIGASTAVFGLLDAILLKPLPYDHPERIAMLWRQAPPTVNVGYPEIPWSRVEFQTLQASNRSFEHVAAFQGDSFALTGRGQPALLDGMRATAEFFSALGMSPALGRTYTDAEDKPGTGHVVVLSDKFWRERFNADPRVLGATIHLNSEPYTVIGVMPAGFSFPRAEEMPASFNFPREVQFWVPMALISGPRTPAETSDLLAVVGRLKPGATLAQAQDDLNSNARAMERLYGAPAKNWFDVHPVPLSAQVAGGTRRPLLL
ncbi:MAG TPA: ABC transporter permease, partial [Terriglobales bacterium]|nr:ABC transporter permease [Terriglobales bacterium]